jgi:hypothetical protein
MNPTPSAIKPATRVSISIIHLLQSTQQIILRSGLILMPPNQIDRDGIAPALCGALGRDLRMLTGHRRHPIEPARRPPIEV